MSNRFPKAAFLFLVIGLVGCSEPEDGALKKNVPQILSEQLSDNIHVLYGVNDLGANVGVLVGDEGVVLIDSMNSKSFEQLNVAIKQITDKPILSVINTHHHADHTGGNPALIENGAYTIAHENARYSPIIPQQMVFDGFTMNIGDEELVAYHVIGHTYNDLLIYLKTSNIMFMGDSFTNVWHPTANIQGLSSETDLVQRVLSLTDENTIIVPGHGHLDSWKGLQRSLRNYEAWYARLTELSQQDIDSETMALDPVLNRMRAAFVESREPPVMADRGFLRFIQRTLSADFVKTISIPIDELQAFAGTYISENGETVELIVENGELFALMETEFYEQLLPVAPLNFHVRFGLTTSYNFKRNPSGKPASFTRHSGGQRIQASRTE